MRLSLLMLSPALVAGLAAPPWPFEVMVPENLNPWKSDPECAIEERDAQGQPKNPWSAGEEQPECAPHKRDSPEIRAEPHQQEHSEADELGRRMDSVKGESWKGPRLQTNMAKFDKDWGEPKENGKWWAGVYGGRGQYGAVPQAALDQAWWKLLDMCDLEQDVDSYKRINVRFTVSDNPTGAMGYVCSWKGSQHCVRHEVEEFRAVLQNKTGTEVSAFAVRINDWAKGFGVVETGTSLKWDSFQCGFKDAIHQEDKPGDLYGQGAAMRKAIAEAAAAAKVQVEF